MRCRHFVRFGCDGGGGGGAGFVGSGENRIGGPGWLDKSLRAGLRSAFPQGQGRHVVENRRSMGDLLAHVMRMYGGTDTTFGETGTIGSQGAVNGAFAGFPSFVNASTPLHAGPLNL